MLKKSPNAGCVNYKNYYDRNIDHRACPRLFAVLRIDPANTRYTCIYVSESYTACVNLRNTLHKKSLVTSNFVVQRYDATFFGVEVLTVHNTKTTK